MIGTLWLSGISLCAALYFLLFTTAGARWLATRIMSATPVCRLDIESGRLWDGLDVRNIQWHQDAFRISIKQMSGRWDLWGLPQRKLRIAQLHADSIFVEIPDTEASESMPWFERLNPNQREAVELPDIQLPLHLSVDDLRVSGMHVTRGDQTNTLEFVTLTANIQKNLLALHHGSVTHAMFSANASGILTLKGDYPLDLRLNAAIEEGYQGNPLELEATFRNHLGDCHINVRSSGWPDLSIKGRVAPLEPSFPMDVNMAWTELTWPLREPFLVRSRHGSIQLDGALDGYRMTATWNLEGEHIPESDWNMIAQGDWRHLVVQTLEGNVLEGTLAAEGDVAWSTQTNLRAHIQLQGVCPERWFAGAPSNLFAQAEISAERATEGWMLDLNHVGMEAQWNDIPLAVAGDVAYRPRTGWRLDAGRITSRDSEIKLDAAWHDQVSASGRVEVADLAVWHPESSGGIMGRFDLQGDPAAPDVSFDLTGENLGWNDRINIGGLDLRGDVVDGAAAGSSLQLQAVDISSPEYAYQIGDLRIMLEGTRAQHRLTVASENGAVDLDMILEGGLDETMQWNARIEEASVAAADFDWTMLNDPGISWDTESGQLVVSPHSWGHADARLHFVEEARLGSSGDITLHLETFDLKELMMPWLPPDIDLMGLMEAFLSAKWGGNKRPEAHLNLKIDQGCVTLSGTGELADEMLRIQLEKFMLESGIGQTQAWLKLDIMADMLGSAKLNAALEIGADGSLDALDGSFSMESLDVEIALPFIPLLHTLEGKINASGQLTGEIRNPRIDGELVLSDGAVESVAIPVNLSGINLRLTLDDWSGMLEGDLRAGKGKATISGTADWSDEIWEAMLSMQGKDLELVYDAVATLTASPDIQLRMGPDEAVVTGRIAIPRAQINLKERPETAVRTSPDTVFVGDDEMPEPSRPRMMDDWTLSMDVGVVLGDQVKISGYGLTSRLAGDLNVQQVIGGVPQVFGELRIVDGEYRAYGRRLTVREGRFLFAGPVAQPDIYVEAVRKVPAYDVDAGLRLEGRPEDPRMTLFSEPALPEEDALSFLILGRPLTGLDDEGMSMLSMAAVSLGVGGGMRLGGVAEEFGLEDLHLDAVGVGEETEVVVSGRIGPRLEMSYGIGVFAPTSRLMMRYRLTQRLFLEAVSSAEDAIDLFYTFSF